MRPRPIAVPILLLFPLALLARAGEPAKPDTPRPSARTEDVFSESEGERAIVYIVPEGARVTKGQVVCVLDAIPASDALKNQKFAVAQAAVSYEQARLTREVAEVAVKEYEQGTFKQSVGTIEGEIALARSDLQRAQDRYDRARARIQRNPLNAEGVAGADANKFNVDRARFALEQAQTRKDVLLKYTRDKTLKELRAEVQKARSDEQARKATLEVELAKIKSMEGPIRPGVILAPIDGTVVLARPTRLVEVGTEVCKDQLLLRIIPPGK